MDLHVSDRGLTRHIPTERLRLRPLDRADLGRLQRLADDPGIAAMTTGIPHPFTDADALAVWRRAADGSAGATWAVDAGDGLCGVVRIGAGLEFWLGRPFRGRGYMTEALRAATAAWFVGTGAGTIAAHLFHDNHAAGAILRATGFRQTGLSARHSLGREGRVIGFDMALTRERWRTVAPLAPAVPLRIDTPRLVLRELRPGDAAALGRIAAAPGTAAALRRAMPVGSAAHPVAAPAAWIDGHRFRGLPPQVLGLGLVACHGAAVLGLAALTPPPAGDAPSLVVALDPVAQGAGLGTEAAAALLAHAVPRWRIDGVRAAHDPGNRAAARMLSRLGFAADPTRDGPAIRARWLAA